MKKNLLRLLILFFLCFILFINSNFLKEFALNILKSFDRTVLAEKRYMLYINGVNTTLIISILSIIFGTLLGLLLFVLNNKNNILRFISKTFVKFLQGIPVTVLLLTFYFGIFGSININPVVVAIIAFSIYFSAYVCEIFNGANESINKVQIVSAYSLGFTKIQTFKYIIVPQVLSYVIPVYKNECVSLIKNTSIAGYISIIELTKVSDMIRNRTYEAFFPLIFTAIIYFLICFIFCKLLDIIYKKVNPRVVKKNEKRIHS